MGVVLISGVHMPNKRNSEQAGVFAFNFDPSVGTKMVPVYLLSLTEAQQDTLCLSSVLGFTCILLASGSSSRCACVGALVGAEVALVGAAAAATGAVEVGFFAVFRAVPAAWV